ncbi:MAG: lmo0937 family membrane protein [Salibacteraceae bacterium]
MEKILYPLALILIIMWLIGYLGFDLSGLIHVLLVLAVISILLRLIRAS